MEPRHTALEPTTVLGASYSTPFTTAVACTATISDPLNYDEGAVRDARDSRSGEGGRVDRRR